MVRHKTVAALAFVNGLSGGIHKYCLTTPMDRERPPQTTAKRTDGFTLTELLVVIAVLVLLVLLASQLLNSASNITTLGHKQMDGDSQARQVLDRMAIDFAQMVKRTDVSYYLKSPGIATDCGACTTQVGNDQMAFYSTVPGYFPSTAQQSPISVVGYRINGLVASPALNKMERLGAGLVWNGAPSGTPVVFWATMNPWPTAASNTIEIVGPDVFRFEYYYLLKSGSLSAAPWDKTLGHSTVNAMQDVAAIVADIAVIDPNSRLLVTDLAGLAATLADVPFNSNTYAVTLPPGGLRGQWRTTIDTTLGLPRPAVSGIRLYERCVYLSPPTVLTP